MDGVVLTTFVHKAMIHKHSKINGLYITGVSYNLRVYCIDVPGVPESSDACKFHGSYYSCILVEVP